MPDLTTYEYDIFLSHNHADQEWTTKLAERLEREELPTQKRKLKVFFSPWDIRPGQSFPKEIERALLKSRKVGLIMSPEAVDSAWVELERLVTTYIAVSARDERLIPLYRRDCEIPALLRPILYVDFRNDGNFEASYQTLLSVIREEPLPRRSPMPPGSLVALTPLIPRPPVVGFVARRDNEGRDIVERLTEELAPQKNQLIALSGPGGVGKTTLATEATRALSGSFGPHIAWISALGREDFALSTLLDEIATQLGHADLRPLGLEPKTAEVQALIASAPTLIILDNFETITTAEQTRCVEFLFSRAACPAVITTRQKITSARNIKIPVMSSEEADDFLQRLVEQASDPTAFAHLDRDRIMHASERNPLVMQWVVGQIDLAQDADAVLEELARGGGDAAQRVFDRSFDLEHLGDDGRASLLALSLFAPDASRAALAEVAGFGEDLKRLNEAVKSLAGLWLVKMASGSRLIIEGLTRELARARLAKDEAANERRERFVTYFLSYAEAHAQATPHDFDALESEKDNILVAMELASAMKNWVSVMKIGLALEDFLDLRGHWKEAITTNAQAENAAREAGDEEAMQMFRGNVAVIHMHRGECKQAEQIFRQSLEYYQKTGSEINIARVLHNLGVLAYERGNLKGAKDFYRKSEEFKHKIGDENGFANTLYQKGMIAEDREDLLEAQRCYGESLKIKRNLGDQNNLAVILHHLAVIARYQSDFSRVRELYLESLEINRSLDDPLAVAITLHMLGINEQDHGFLDEARQYYHESLEMSQKLGFQLGTATTLHELGMVAERQGDSIEAQKHYDESRRIRKELANQRGLVTTLPNVGMGKLRNRRGIAATLYSFRLIASDDTYRAEASRLLREAVYIFEKLKSPDAETARRRWERPEGKSSEPDRLGQ